MPNAIDDIPSTSPFVYLKLLFALQLQCRKKLESAMFDAEIILQELCFGEFLVIEVLSFLCVCCLTFLGLFLVSNVLFKPCRSLLIPVPGAGMLIVCPAC